MEEQRAKHEREIGFGELSAISHFLSKRYLQKSFLFFSFLVGLAKERERQIREALQQSADSQRQAEMDTHQEALRTLAKREAAFAQDMMVRHTQHMMRWRATALQYVSCQRSS